LQHFRHEPLNNVLKHARAQHVEVRLDLTNELVVLEINDDGVGFEASRERGEGLRKGLPEEK
jgi:signal transduction histidine kinase